MSLFLSCLPLRAVAVTLACGTAFVVLGGCYHRSSELALSHPDRASSSRDRDDRLARGFPGAYLVATRRGGFNVRVMSGLTSGGEPLYVIDGHPMFVDPNRGIDWFGPEDIVGLSVLKTPSETGVYGPRGVHGVILIATKQGSRRR